jgi:hypothetical protein
MQAVAILKQTRLEEAKAAQSNHSQMIKKRKTMLEGNSQI